MRLSSADRRFIRALTGEQADRAMQVFEQRSEYLATMTSARRGRNLGSDLVGVAALALRALFGGSPRDARTSEAAFYERSAAVVPVRRQFIAEYLSDARMAAVSTSTRPSGAGVVVTMQVLAATLRAVLSADRREPSALADGYVDVAACCLRALAASRVTSGRTCYLFRTYRLEVPVMAGFLSAQGIRAALVTGTSPLGYHQRVMAGDVAVLSTPYQAEEFERYRPLGDEGACVVWGPESVIGRRHVAPDSTEAAASVGVYTQGYWLRRHVGSIGEDEVGPFIRLENEFVDLMAEYARRHPDVRVVVFPHPMERRHAKAGGGWGYEGLLCLPNVELAAEDGVGSLDLLGAVGLGVTSASNVGFDRLHLGHRTLFYVGDDSDAFPRLEGGAYDGVIIGDRESFLRAIEVARLQTDTDFLAIHGLPGGKAVGTGPEQEGATA